MKEKQNQPSSMAEVRASLYSALALGFSAPDEGTLKEVSGRLPEVLREASSLFVMSVLEDMIKNFEASINASDRTSLKAEYHRLFVGPYKLPAPPYASVYLETEPTVMGPSTLEVLRMYEEAGFRLSPSFKDLPDHIAAELEFMALLCEEERESWQKADFAVATKLLSREENFLGEHPVRWTAGFSSKILSSTDFPFYRALAFLLKDYVLFDLDCVRALRRLLEARETTALMKEGAIDGA